MTNSTKYECSWMSADGQGSMEGGEYATLEAAEAAMVDFSKELAQVYKGSPVHFRNICKGRFIIMKDADEVRSIPCSEYEALSVFEDEKELA